MFFLNRVNVLILSALPLALITGPALPDIIISLSSIIFVIITIKKKDLSVKELKSLLRQKNESEW